MKTREKILVAESESIIAMDIGHQLSEWGFKHSEVALSRSDVPSLVKRKKPNLLIMDNDFYDGDQDIQSAVELHKKYDISVILLIDWMTEELKQAMKKLKSFYCIPKPFDRDELHGLIEEALRSKNKKKKKAA
ncbi:response regulator [bacterium]|nr:response regulator [bacterium]